MLVGGLGLGFSLKRVLELVDSQAEVWVAELLPDVVRWNREHLQGLNGKLLDEKRVRVFTGDVSPNMLPAITRNMTPPSVITGRSSAPWCQKPGSASS